MSNSRNPLRYRIKRTTLGYDVFDAKLPGNKPVGTFIDHELAELFVSALHYRDEVRAMEMPDAQ